MTAKPDRYEQEVQRIGQLLLRIANERKVSIRSLERKMGVSTSVFRKALVGESTLTLRHILMIADGLGLEWRELFDLAYGGLGDGTFLVQEAVRRRAGAEDTPQSQEIERHVRLFLLRLLLDAGPLPGKDEA